MERNYMNPDALAEFDFVEDLSLPSHYHENIEMLFILDGKMQVKVEETDYCLEKDDILLVNASRYHSYIADEGLLAVRFQLSASKIAKLLHRSNVIFWCSSTAEENEAFAHMRGILMKILFAAFDSEDPDEIYMNSLYYQLLTILTANFLISEKNAVHKEETSEDRIQEIFSYIRANYQNPISLQDVADELFLSPTYLSKYIRRNTGMGFVDLINSVRLNHAMEDLMYTETSIMKIAMDNGFASVAALNKVFREAYQMTPSEFRREKKPAVRQKRKTDEQIVQKAVSFLTSMHPKETEEKKDDILIDVDLRTAEKKDYVFPMILMVNAGEAHDLNRTAAQQEILLCQKKLGTRYIRIWNLFDESMLINIHADSRRINFGKVDEVLDFLVRNGLKPYIELRNKRYRLISTMGRILQEEQPEDDFASAEERRVFLHALMKHLLKRFGILEVKDWYFDLCMKTDTVFKEDHFELISRNEEHIQEYLDEFNDTAQILRFYIPDIKIGGAGFPVHHYGCDGLEKVFGLWRTYEQHPSFVTVTSFPYQLVCDQNTTYEKRKTDVCFLMNDLATVRKALDNTGFSGVKIHVVETNLTLSSRNPVNDSLHRAAMMVFSHLKCCDMAEIIGIWNLRDSYAELAGSPDYLFGGCGMLTKTSIEKPVFKAAGFMKRLYEQVIEESEDYAVTVNEANHLKIICHNMRRFNLTYFKVEEDQIRPENLDLMMEDRRCRHIHLRISGVDDYMWQVRRYRLNQDHGSILNEWIRIGMDSDMIYEDIEYLEKICEPALLVNKIRPKDGILEFDITMDPNEVQYLHVTHATDD